MESNYSFPKRTKECFATRHVFEPGEWLHSVLIEEANGRFSRRDYTIAAWQKIFEQDDTVSLPMDSETLPDPERLTKPDGVVGDWRTRIPEATSPRRKWAPNEILSQFFDELAERPGQLETRYILALLLVRRRLLVVEEEVSGQSEVPEEAGLRVLVLRNVKLDQIYRVPMAVPSPARQVEIQQQLMELLGE